MVSREKSLKIELPEKSKLKDINNESIHLENVKESSKDSVRAIMLIRAYRIRGHLIASLDPLSLLKKEEHPELKPETYGFAKRF